MCFIGSGHLYGELQYLFYVIFITGILINSLVSQTVTVFPGAVT